MDQSDSYNKPTANPHKHHQPSNSELMASAKLLAGAAQSSMGNESNKIDKARVAGAAADLLEAASQYGKLEEKSYGKYVEKAETYLHQYGHSTTTTTTTHSAVRRLILHEFLSGTFNKDSPPTSTSLGSQELHQPTLLSLSSGSHFPKQSALGSSTICPSTTKKRTHQYIYDPTDSRHKRMIKNRESAARSRAKKQAYTTKLEHELAHLRQENARLRRQQEKHFWLRPSDQHPQKSTLHRTSTAPF